jgi:hypothetical protein
MRAPLPAFQIGQFAATQIRWRLETQEIPRPDREPHEAHLQTLRLTLNWPAQTGSNEFVVSARHIGIEQP